MQTTRWLLLLLVDGPAAGCCCALGLTLKPGEQIIFFAGSLKIIQVEEAFNAVVKLNGMTRGRGKSYKFVGLTQTQDLGMYVHTT